MHTVIGRFSASIYSFKPSGAPRTHNRTLHNNTRTQNGNMTKQSHDTTKSQVYDDMGRVHTILFYTKYAMLELSKVHLHSKARTTC